MKKRDVERFIKRLVEHFGADGATELDLDEFLEESEDCGLIRWEVYNPSIHDNTAEAGDKVWVSVPAKDGDDDDG